MADSHDFPFWCKTHSLPEIRRMPVSEKTFSLSISASSCRFLKAGRLEFDLPRRAKPSLLRRHLQLGG